MLARQDGGKPRLSNERYRTAARRAAEHLHISAAITGAWHGLASTPRPATVTCAARPGPLTPHMTTPAPAVRPLPASTDKSSGPAIPDTGPLDFPSYAERQGHACLGKARLSVGGR